MVKFVDSCVTDTVDPSVFEKHLLVMLLQNFIYFGDSREPVIYIYDKTNLNFISSRRLRESGGITDMAMFAREVQPPQKPSSKLLLRTPSCSRFITKLHCLK